MTKVVLHAAGILIQPLTKLEPRLRGAGGIEALSSYIVRQSFTHCCAPYTLFSTLLVPASEKLSKRWFRVRHGESHLVNAYGAIAKTISEEVSSAAGLSSASQMTFLGIGGLCDPRAKHLVHKTRPWCSECYIEARNLQIPCWDPLYTMLRTTKVCVWHKKYLRLRCEQCGRGQRYLPRFPYLDYCEHCGADLALQGMASQLTDRNIEADIWTGRAALEMLDAVAMGRPMKRADFAENVKTLIATHFKGSAQAFTKKLGIAGSSPKNWLTRSSFPTWSSLVDLAYRLDTPPSRLAGKSPELTDPLYWRTLPPLLLDKPHRRPSNSKILLVKADLEARLAQTDFSGRDPEGVRTLAKRLDLSYGTMFALFPKHCKLLIEQRKTVLSERRKRNKAQIDLNVQAAADLLRSQDRPITSRNLKSTGKLSVSELIGSAKRLSKR